MDSIYGKSAHNTSWDFIATQRAKSCELTRTLMLGNLPMQRVKFDAKMEYEYLDNFKILQKAFKSNGVDKVSLGFRYIA